MTKCVIMRKKLPSREFFATGRHTGLNLAPVVQSSGARFNRLPSVALLAIWRAKPRACQGDFQYSGKYVYCGDKVHGKPVEISDSRVKMEYTDERTGKKGYLILYPFKRGEMKNLLAKTRFASIEQFSDYNVGKNHSADFYQYVCIK